MLRRLASIVALGALASCAHGLSPAEIDQAASSCRARIDDGSMTLHPSRGVGLPAQPKARGEPVVIYGASWCSACAMAKAYLTRRGIPFVDRDVEEDASAAAARDVALASVGLPPTRDLPVVDVRGTVTVGFKSCVVEAAWR